MIIIIFLKVTDMKTKIIILVLLIVALSLTSIFIMTEKSEAQIIGRWYRDDGIYIEFFENGVWHCAEDFEGYGGIWSLNGDRIHMTDLLENDFTGILHSDNNSLTLNGKLYKKILEKSYKFHKSVDER